MPGESFVTWTLTPIASAAEVRGLTGYVAESDCPTADLNALIKMAQVFVAQELSDRVHNVPMWGAIDGVNTRFQVPPRFTGRVLLDAQNSGDEADSLEVYLRSPATGANPPTYTLATVASIDALHGIVTLDTAPAPATVDQVLFTGLLVRSAVTMERFKNVVQLYAACLLDVRVRRAGAVNLANPKAQQNPAAPESSRWWTYYQREVRSLRNPGPRVAARRLAPPVDGDGFPHRTTW
jgi:hypothetical protein